MTKLLTWLRHRYVTIQKKFQRVRYSKLTRDVHLLMDEIMERWRDEGEYYRNEDRHKLCNMLYDYEELLYQNWDHHTSSIEQECCEQFIKQMIDHFSAPFMRYDLEFYEHYMTFLEIYHSFNPITLKSECKAYMKLAQECSIIKEDEKRMFLQKK